MAVGFEWREISDLPEELSSLRDRELEALSEVGTERKEHFLPIGLPLSTRSLPVNGPSKPASSRAFTPSIVALLRR
jgi:hypothetical protein